MASLIGDGEHRLGRGHRDMYVCECVFAQRQYNREKESMHIHTRTTVFFGGVKLCVCCQAIHFRTCMRVYLCMCLSVALHLRTCMCTSLSLRVHACVHFQSQQGQKRPVSAEMAENVLALKGG